MHNIEIICHERGKIALVEMTVSSDNQIFLRFM
jgi:hypothetical protein